MFQTIHFACCSDGEISLESEIRTTDDIEQFPDSASGSENTESSWVVEQTDFELNFTRDAASFSNETSIEFLMD